jgi:dihydrofolate synthase/folylpolyglutamate synthase
VDLVTREDAASGPAADVALPLPGDHQRVNAALALATVRALAGKIPVPDAALRRGLETVEWAGRLQLVRTGAGRMLLIDGAHNPAGAESLRAAVEKYFPQQPRALVLGLLQDKDVAGICRTVAPLAESIIAVRVDSPRAAAPESIAELCRAAHPPARVAVAGSIAAALAETAGAPFTIVTGSLHFIGQVLETLGATPADTGSERALNEWNALRSEWRPRS